MQNVTAQIEARLMENKTAVKTYASHQFANSNGQKVADAAKVYYDAAGDLRYLVVFLPTFKRYTVVFLFGEFMRSNNVGGYVGFVNDKGFYTV